LHRRGGEAALALCKAWRKALEAGALSVPLLEAATLLALPDFCPALLAIPSGWLVFHIGEPRIDLTDYWRGAVEACRRASAPK